MRHLAAVVLTCPADDLQDRNEVCSFDTELTICDVCHERMVVMVGVKPRAGSQVRRLRLLPRQELFACSSHTSLFLQSASETATPAKA